MKFPAKGGNDFAIAPVGNHLAICNAIVDLGLQPGSVQYPEPKHQVYIRFELPDEVVEYEKDGVKISGPMSIGRTFTASMSPKANLRKFVESWFGKSFPSDDAAAAFDFQHVLGRKCLLNVSHTERDGKTYANISAATPLPKSMATAEVTQHNPSLYFDLSAPSRQTFAALPEWLRKKIDSRLQTHSPSVTETDGTQSDDPFDDSIPFAWAFAIPLAGLIAVYANTALPMVA